MKGKMASRYAVEAQVSSQTNSRGISSHAETFGDSRQQRQPSRHLTGSKPDRSDPPGRFTAPQQFESEHRLISLDLYPSYLSQHAATSG
jgi:hypothetical protein